MHRAAAVAVLAVALVACADATTEPGAAGTPPTTDTTIAADGQRFPDVVDVVATFDAADETWTFAVTMSSPYDTPDRYADGWRVLDADGTVLGEHTLTHDHAAEQPFTRTQRGVAVPAETARVTVEGRDSVHGYGGATMTITLDTETR